MAEKHAILTGPITGLVRLPDGSEVDVTPALVYVDSPEQAAEVAHQIGLAHAKHGHPDDVELDAKGERVQRAFAYDDSHHKAHARGKKG